MFSIRIKKSYARRRHGVLINVLKLNSRLFPPNISYIQPVLKQTEHSLHLTSLQWDKGKLLQFTVNNFLQDVRNSDSNKNKYKGTLYSPFFCSKKIFKFGGIFIR